jgi:hypothetical protein
MRELKPRAEPRVLLPALRAHRANFNVPASSIRKCRTVPTGGLGGAR